MDTTIKTVRLNVPQIPPCQYTVEEIQASVREAIEAFERGEGIPHSEIKRKNPAGMKITCKTP